MTAYYFRKLWSIDWKDLRRIRRKTELTRAMLMGREKVEFGKYGGCGKASNIFGTSRRFHPGN